MSRSPALSCTALLHSPELARYRTSPRYRRCLLALKLEFVRELEQRTGVKIYNETETKDLLSR